MSCPGFLRSANPRLQACERCGKLENAHPLRTRNCTVERELTTLAARAAGFSSDAGLWQFADARALPGGIRRGLDATQEAGEELGDACNYLTWRLEELRPAFVAGESEATDEYHRLMRTLAHVVAAWHALIGR